MDDDELRDMILGTVTDLVGNLLYYDRKDDEELEEDDIQDAVARGVVSIDDIVNEFRTALEKGLE